MFKKIKKEIVLIKNILNKMFKFMKTKNNYKFIHIYNFFLLRYLYTRPYFRFLIKGKKNISNEICHDKEVELNLDIEKVVKNLKSDTGYSIGHKIGESVVNKVIENYTTDIENIEVDHQLKNFLESKNVSKQKLVKKQNESVQEYVNRIKNLGTHQIRFSDGKIFRENIVKKIIQSKPLTQLATNYLNARKFNVINEMVISLPKEENISREILKQSSQTFHRDLVSKNFFKAFIFLTDVNKNDGSHIYLEGSHKINLHHDSNKNDFEIEEMYNNCKRKEIDGKKGDLFFGDTFCLHKGNKPVNNFRLLLILTFFTGMSLQNLDKKNLLEVVG